MRYLRNLQNKECMRKYVLYKNPSTLSRVPEEAHPSECHLRVVFHRDDTHEGAKSHNWEGAKSFQMLQKRLCFWP